MGDETNPRLRTIVVHRDATALVRINALMSRGLRDAVALACKTPGKGRGNVAGDLFWVHSRGNSGGKRDVEHLQDFVAVVVDDFDGQFAGSGAAGGGVEGGPGGFVDLGAQGEFQFVSGLVGTGEVSVADDPHQITLYFSESWRVG